MGGAGGSSSGDVSIAGKRAGGSTSTSTLDCGCPAGFVQTNASEGQWQCNRVDGGGKGGSSSIPLWVIATCAACGVVTVASLVFAVYTTRVSNGAPISYTSSSDVYEGF